MPVSAAASDSLTTTQSARAMSSGGAGLAGAALRTTLAPDWRASRAARMSGGSGVSRHMSTASGANPSNAASTCAGGERRVGAGSGDYAVFAGGVDGDEADTGARFLVDRHKGAVETLGVAHVEQLASERVGAHAAYEARLGAHARGGDGLIQPLSAGGGDEAAAQDGLAPFGRGLDAGDEVHHAGADDDNARRHGFGRRWALGGCLLQ